MVYAAECGQKVEELALMYSRICALAGHPRRVADPGTLREDVNLM